jgi:hypothetical protein
MKTCNKCGELKLIHDFSKKSDAPSGRRNICKQCCGKTQLWTRYRITHEDYRQILERQGGSCAICTRLCGIMHVDHDHSTHKVRGILCSACNRGLGYLQDNIEILEKAIAYLRSAK